MSYWCPGCISILQVILIDDLADTCFTLLNAVTQLVRVGGAKNVHVFVTHAVMSQMPQDLFCCPELIRWEEVVMVVGVVEEVMVVIN